MSRVAAKRARIAAFAALLLAGAARAGEVTVVAAELSREGPGQWRASVTLAHGDTGWEHYADAWRVVDAGGAVLGTRTLYHPHVDEQPFTRSLSGIAIAPGTATVWVEAHDKVHGWSDRRLELDLSAADDGRVRAGR